MFQGTLNGVSPRPPLCASMKVFPAQMGCVIQRLSRKMPGRFCRTQLLAATLALIFKPLSVNMVCVLCAPTLTHSTNPLDRH